MEKIDIAKIDVLLKNLNRNNINGSLVKNKEELITLLDELLEKGQTIGCGDSITLEELEVFEYLRKGNYNFLDKHNPNLTKQEKRKIYINNFSADVFISGTNAITMKGELFNIDGNGSRVAPMIYGPSKVIIVVGINKLVNNVDDAIHRARQIAAPLDARRLNKNTPCTKLDKCIDCKNKERICNDFILITGQFDKNRIHVIIVEEELGY